MDALISQLVQISKLPPNQQPQQLALTLSVRLTNPHIVQLNNTNAVSKQNVLDLVDASNIYNNEWLAFNEVVCSFINLSSQLNAFSLLQSFDLYAQYLSDLSVAFNNNARGYLVSLLVRDTVDVVLPMATKLDLLLYYKENCIKPRLTYVASLMLKMFNNIRSQLGAGDQAEAVKKSIIVYLGVKLCLVYFKIDNPLLCRNIFSNMNNAQLNFKGYSPNEQIQYRYYLGRFYLIKNQFIDAYHHFMWCLLNCPPVKDSNNVTKILDLLIPVAILVGKVPKFDNIANAYYSPGNVPFLFEVYRKLAIAIKAGDFGQLEAVVSNEQYYSVLKSKQLLVPFTSKANLLVLRNLVKRVWINTGKSSKLEFDDMKLALLLSCNKCRQPVFQSIDDVTVENVFVTLIDQNLIKGKIFPRLRGVSLSKINVFPPVGEINFVKFGYGGENVLLPSDRWMN